MLERSRRTSQLVASALVALGLLIADPAHASRDGVVTTIFGNIDEVLGCSPSPCHRPITAASAEFVGAPAIVAQGEIVDLTLRISGGPGVSCGFTADTLGAAFSVAQPDPLVQYFGFGSPPRTGLTHSAPRLFDASVCEFILRWEATVLGSSRIGANTISANGDRMRGGDAGWYAEIAIAVAPRVYRITPYDLGSGFSIDSGWIGTVETAPDDGLLSAAEIDSFHIVYTHPGGQDTLTNADSTTEFAGDIAISPTQIWVPDESPADHANELVIDDDSPFAFLRWRSNADGFGDFQAITAQEPAGLAVTTLQLPPGSIEIASVPEPSSFALRAISLSALALLRARRSRRIDPERNSRLRPR